MDSEATVDFFGGPVAAGRWPQLPDLMGGPRAGRRSSSGATTSAAARGPRGPRRPGGGAAAGVHAARHGRDRPPRRPRPDRGGPGALRARRAARAAGAGRSGSWRCRATTAGRRWPARRSATTCTPCTPRSPRRCWPPPRPTTRSRPGRRLGGGRRGRGEPGVGHAERDLHRRASRPRAAVGRAARRTNAAGRRLTSHREARVSTAWRSRAQPVTDDRAQRLRKSYGELAAVDGVSFEVAAGEFFGILGPERRRQDHHPGDHRGAARARTPARSRCSASQPGPATRGCCRGSASSCRRRRSSSG